MTTQHLQDRDPETLLTINEVAPLIGKAAATVRTDVTRSPETLPPIYRLGYHIRFRLGDVLAFRESSRVPTPAPLRTRVKAELRAQ